MTQPTRISGEHWHRFRAALRFADLTADNVELSGRTFFEFTLGGKKVGWGGFEMHGADGLLRPLVIAPAYRSKGLGVAVLQVIEPHVARTP